MKKIVFILRLLLLVSYCNKNPVDGGNFHLPTPAYPSPYSDPSWSADGKTIVFYRMKVTHIGSIGDFTYDPDSTGIWAIDADGTNMRLLLRGRGDSPELSPDGTWLVYEEGGQIYKVPFVDGVVDTTNIVQLTTEGRNFFPAWSPDGEWIAYERSVCEGDSTCGVWIISSNGEEKRFIDDYGMYPAWRPFGKEILYVRRAVTTSGQVLGDSLWVFNVENNEKMFLTFLRGENYDNRYPQYSPDGTKITFSSQKERCSPHIWIMDADGSNLKQLTQKGGTSSCLVSRWQPNCLHSL